jgi:hypothetical protein
MTPSYLENGMSQYGMIFTALLAAIVLFRSRYGAVVAIISAVCFLPQSETLNIGFHFYSIRIELLAGVVRVLVRRETKSFRWGSIDKALLVYTLTILIIASIRAPEQFITRIGNLYDAVLGYYVLRCLIRNADDFYNVLLRAVWILVPFAVALSYECVTKRNFFHIFNGIDEYSWIRQGHVRAQGPFRNPITCGAFGATFAMLYASLWFAKQRSKTILLGLIASGIIVWASHSSGPFLGVALGITALIFWRVRRYTKAALITMVVSLVLLNFAMKVPVWFLIGRISNITGGGGYHRALLIDQAVNHVGQWWLAGTSDTGDWFQYQLELNEKADITNYYVAAAVDAGTLGLIFAVTLTIACFKQISRAYAAQEQPRAQKLLWGLGATMIATIGILFSVTYMDQQQILWFFLLASIAALPRGSANPVASRLSASRRRLVDRPLPLEPTRS